jgi:O-antigen ligase
MADTWSERISTSTELETESSFQGRVEMSKASMRIVENHPLLGGGFDVIYVPQVITKYIPSNLEPRAIHSSYFQMIAEHGYTGLILFMLMIYMIFHTARSIQKVSYLTKQISKASELSIALRASIVGYFVMSLTLNMAFFDILYFLIAVTAIADQFYRQKKPTVQQKIKQEAFSAA